ncbi:hypothetical protein C7E17_23785, partial [Stenotrophomonas maltophilia]
FTGEEVVELQGHGSPVLLQQLVARCIALGARQARPGEFSERAPVRPACCGHRQCTGCTCTASAPRALRAPA